MNKQILIDKLLYRKQQKLWQWRQHGQPASPNVVSMMGNRLRRRPSIDTTLIDTRADYPNIDKFSVPFNIRYFRQM